MGHQKTKARECRVSTLADRNALGVPHSTLVPKPYAPAQIVTAISALINKEASQPGPCLPEPVALATQVSFAIGAAVRDDPAATAGETPPR